VTLDRDLVVQALPAYEVGDEIGRGGWALVLSARHRALDRQVAVKQLPRAFAADPAVLERFRSEARVVARLDHPHIVPVYDFVEHEGACLLVMELMEPWTLWDRFVAHGVAIDVACALALAAGTALHHAHDHGVLHRDVKPGNLLFSASGTIKLSDFGIAKVIGPSARALTTTGTVIGTPAYLAPEQAMGEKLDVRTDLYSLGIVLYELATGALPFGESRDPMRQLTAKISEDPQPVTELRPDLHPALADVIMRAVARSRDQRQTSVHELCVDLAGAATVAFGPGWLRACGIGVLAAPDLLAVTERDPRPAAGPTPVGTMDPSVQIQPSESSHPRLGAFAPRDSVEGRVAMHLPEPPPAPADPGPGPAIPAPPPPPEPSPAPAPAQPQGHTGFDPALRVPPPPSPGVTVSPPATGRRRRRWPARLLLCVLAVIAALSATLAVRSRLQTASSTTSTGPTGTLPGEDTGPVIVAVRDTSLGVELEWRDRLRPDQRHVLLAFSSADPQEYPLPAATQRINLTGRPKYCFVVAQADDRDWHSDHHCINGADWNSVVKG
jgi:serine/threonine protein kinase